jgi:putative peptidoglycan lipid II flippase
MVKFGAPAVLSGVGTGRDELTLALLVGAGAVVYVLTVLALFGRSWLASLIR